MAKRINIILEDETEQTIKRAAKPGERSRFINRAVQYYAATRIRPAKLQTSFRTAWRSLVKAAAKRAGDAAAEQALKAGIDPEAARRSATKPFTSFRFHDLRHQSITEMAEAGVPEAAMQSICRSSIKKNARPLLPRPAGCETASCRNARRGRIVQEPDVQQSKGKAN